MRPRHSICVRELRDFRILCEILSMNNLLNEIVSHLKARGPDEGGWYTALCPYHNDHAPSLRFTIKGFRCMACGANGSIRDLAHKLNIAVQPTRAERRRELKSGITLVQLAQAKSLPLEHLTNLGWHDVEYQQKSAVAMPCYDPSGNVLREQLRLRRDNDTRRERRFNWGPGHGVWPFGLDRLVKARTLGYILIVEGATDYAACLMADIPVLGVPGANTWKSDWAAYLEDVKSVIVWEEPDQGGKNLVQAIAKVRSDVLVIQAPDEAKDPCELHQLDPDLFAERLSELITSAAPVDVSPKGDHGSDVDREGTRVGVELDPLAKNTTGGSAADRVIGYVLEAGTELFHDQHGDTFITFSNPEGRRENWQLKSKAASDYIRWIFYKKEEKGLSGEALSTARGAMSARARFDGAQHHLSVRVARQGETIWYDLGDWRAVLVNSKGWQVVTDPPILFRYYPHQVVQVEPLAGGNLEDFLGLVNVVDQHSRILLLVYMVAGLLPEIPLPVLVVHGEQGVAKSFLFRLLRALLDPSSLATLTYPANIREFVQLAAHHRTAYLDNLTSLPQWLSDALCRLCTGEGFSKRELFTDDDDIIYNLKGLGGLNGVNLVAVRPDLLDRSMILRLDPIDESKRRTEQEVWSEFEEMRPRILGAMLEALSQAISYRSRVRTDNLPRLADFALCGMAISEAIGYSAHDFLEAYTTNVSAQKEAAIEESVVAQALLKFLVPGNEWEGTASELHQKLEDSAEQLHISTRAKAWPKAPNVLARRMRENAPNLRRAGVQIKERKLNGQILWHLARQAPRNTAPIAPTAMGKSTATSTEGRYQHPMGDISPPKQETSPPCEPRGTGERGGRGDKGDISGPLMGIDAAEDVGEI